MHWWSEWFLPLLIASGVLLIFKGGWMVTLLLWIIYLLNGKKQVEAIKKMNGENPTNEKELGNHRNIGAAVIVISFLVQTGACS